MDKAKVFMSGRSQAVRLPKDYRFNTDEVFICKIGDVVMLVPPDALKKEFKDGTAMFTEDFFGSFKKGGGNLNVYD